MAWLAVVRLAVTRVEVAWRGWAWRVRLGVCGGGDGGGGVGGRAAAAAVAASLAAIAAVAAAAAAAAAAAVFGAAVVLLPSPCGGEDATCSMSTSMKYSMAPIWKLWRTKRRVPLSESSAISSMSDSTSTSMSTSEIRRHGAVRISGSHRLRQRIPRKHGAGGGRVAAVAQERAWPASPSSQSSSSEEDSIFLTLRPLMGPRCCCCCAGGV